MHNIILITGGIGFVGSSIVKACKEKHPEWQIIVLDLKHPEQPLQDVMYELGNILDCARLEEVFRMFKPSVVIHTAGIVPALAMRYSRQDDARVFDINVNGTRNMLRVAKESGVEAFVWTGSCTAVIDDCRREYRNIDETFPTSKQSLIYGETKVRRSTWLSHPRRRLPSTSRLLQRR